MVPVKGLAPTAVVLAIAIGAAAGILRDRYERALLASGNCEFVMEVLHTPAPEHHTSCYGTPPTSCSTWSSQPDPYLRSLWRCPDPDRDGARVEFWRRSAERLSP